MFINGAFVSPERRSPVARTNRKRRSPTAPSRRRSIASGWSNAGDLTGVRLKRSTLGMATSYGLRWRGRLPSRGPRSVSLTCPVRGDRMQTEQEPIRYDERAWKPRPTLSGPDYTSVENFDEER